MSFGAPNATKAAENNLGGISQQATGLSTSLANAGQGLLGQAQPLIQQGSGIIQSGLPSLESWANYYNTLLNGNQSNTNALLQPSINTIRGGNQNTIQAMSSLDPRGGGRSGTLFNAAYAPSQQIQSLFNTGRTTGATALPQIGSAISGVGSQLAGLGTNVLGTGAGLFAGASNPLAAATGANSSMGNLGIQTQQMSNSLFGGLGGGLLGLLTAPQNNANGTSNGSFLSRLAGIF